MLACCAFLALLLIKSSKSVEIHSQNDILESEMMREVENGRLVRLLSKFGFINERPE